MSGQGPEWLFCLPFSPLRLPRRAFGLMVLRVACTVASAACPRAIPNFLKFSVIYAADTRNVC